MTRRYRCISLEYPTKRFTVGEEYPVLRQQGLLDVIGGDDPCYEHHISPKDPRFIVANLPDIDVGWMPSVPRFAHFEVLE